MGDDDLNLRYRGAKRPAQRRHATEILAEAGRDLYGEEWAAHLARFTGTNERTVRRIRQAAGEGREYPAAAGVLAGLIEGLERVRTALRPYRRP